MTQKFSIFKIPRRVIFVLLLILTCYPILVPIILPIHVNDRTITYYNFIKSIPDGSTVAIVLNPNTLRQNVQLKWKGRSFIYGLLGRSVTTFKWPNNPDARVEVWITTADQTKLLEKQFAINFY